MQAGCLWMQMFRVAKGSQWRAVKLRSFLCQGLSPVETETTHLSCPCSVNSLLSANSLSLSSLYFYTIYTCVGVYLYVFCTLSQSECTPAAVAHLNLLTQSPLSPHPLWVQLSPGSGAGGVNDDLFAAWGVGSVGKERHNLLRIVSASHGPEAEEERGQAVRIVPSLSGTACLLCEQPAAGNETWLVCGAAKRWRTLEGRRCSLKEMNMSEGPPWGEGQGQVEQSTLHCSFWCARGQAPGFRKGRLSGEEMGKVLLQSLSDPTVQRTKYYCSVWWCCEIFC